MKGQDFQAMFRLHESYLSYIFNTVSQYFPLTVCQRMYFLSKGFCEG